MRISNLTLLLIAAILFFASSCRKVDNLRADLGRQELIYEQSIGFLENEKLNVSRFQQSKIEVLQHNITARASTNFQLNNGIEIFVFDLDEYKNKPSPQYKNTIYKICFIKGNGSFKAAIILSIHTNQSKENIDNDIQGIVLKNSKKFSGVITTNLINDRFIQAATFIDGKLTKDQQLSTNPPDDVQKQSKNHYRGGTDNCSHYYLVTTTIYADGHVEQNWEYLYSICSPCLPTGTPVSTIETDCDPNGVPGGGVAPEIIEKIDETSETTEVVEEDLGTAPMIKYAHRSHIQKVVQTGMITYAEAYDVVITNPVEFYINTYGRNTTRKLLTLGHLNSSNILGTTVLFYWSCNVMGNWTYADGGAPLNRMWLHTYSAIR